MPHAVRWICKIIGIALLALPLAPGGALAQNFNPGQTPFVNWLTNGLPNYTVTPGAASNFPGCTPFLAAFGTCFGNNTATPYILIQPPPDTPNNLPIYAQASAFKAHGTADSDFWQVGPDEAIVTIVTLPPQAAYFGVQSYMLERSAATYTTPPGGTQCTGGTKYQGFYTETPDCNFVVFGPFANTVNNADVANFTGLPEWNPWNSGAPQQYNTIAIITTPNKTLAANMVSAFSGDARRIFTETMPATSLPGDPPGAHVVYPCNGGVTAPCDVFATVLRYTLPDPTNGNGGLWLSGNNVLVYRVKQPSSMSVTNTDLYEAGDVYNSLYRQGCNTNETVAAGAPCPTASTNFDTDLKTIAQALQLWAQNSANVGVPYGVAQASGTGSTSVNGGVGTCIKSGMNCFGPTQDNNFYRIYSAGTLANRTPAFVVGVLHSASTGDFTSPTPVNNADYTGISIADNSPTYNNTGVSDSANPNSNAEYTDQRPNRFLLGSAYTVLNYLRYGPQNATLYSQLPASVQADINNIYIHVFQRNDSLAAGGGTQANGPCALATCSNELSNDLTSIIGGSTPAVETVTFPAAIPDNDPVLFTERGYLLSPMPGTTPSPQVSNAYLTGAAVQYLESPYIVCDKAFAGCGQ